MKMFLAVSGYLPYNEKNIKRKAETHMCYRPIERAVQKDGKWGFLRRGWDWGFPDELYPRRGVPQSDLAMFADNGKIGFVHRSGMVIHDCTFDAVNLFYDYEWDCWCGDRMGYYDDRKVAAAAVCQNGKWGFLSRKDGHWISQCQWETVDYFWDGLSRVSAGGKWGAIDGNGCQVIPCEWDEMDGITWSSQIRVRKGTQWSFIDREGNQVFSHSFDYVGKFNKDRAQVRVDGKWKSMNRQGELYRPGSGAYDFAYGVAPAGGDGRVGLIDYDGNEIIPCQWDNVFILSQKLVEVWRDHKTGLFHLDGTQVYPCTLQQHCPFLAAWPLQNRTENGVSSTKTERCSWTSSGTM